MSNKTANKILEKRNGNDSTSHYRINRKKKPNKKTYEVATKFVFEGVFKVVAENGSDALQKVADDCGLVLGGNIHSTLPDEEIDWNFETHPETKIIAIKPLKQ